MSTREADQPLPVVYLTFDDGPTSNVTAPVLDLLGAHEARATFFAVGRRVGERPETAQRALSEGHTIANQTRDDAKGWQGQDDGSVREQIEGASVLIDQHVGIRPTLFRPPWGHIGIRDRPEVEQRLRREVGQAGMTLVGWHVYRGDTPAAEASPAIVSEILSRTGPTVVLLHDQYDGDQQVQADNAIATIGLILDRLAGRAEFRALPGGFELEDNLCLSD